MGDIEEPYFEDGDILVTRYKTHIRSEAVAHDDIERVESVSQGRRVVGHRPILIAGLLFLVFAVYLAIANQELMTVKVWVQIIAVLWIGLSLVWKGFPRGKDLQTLKLRMKNGDEVLYTGAPAQVDQAKTMIELARSRHASGSKT